MAGTTTNQDPQRRGFYKGRTVDIEELYRELIDVFLEILFGKRPIF